MTTAHELAREAYQAAPVGATLEELRESDSVPRYRVTCGAHAVVLDTATDDDAGVEVFVWSMTERDGGEGWAVWEVVDDGAGDAHAARTALADWVANL